MTSIGLDQWILLLNRGIDREFSIHEVQWTLGRLFEKRDLLIDDPSYPIFQGIDYRAFFREGNKCKSRRANDLHVFIGILWPYPFGHSIVIFHDASFSDQTKIRKEGFQIQFSALNQKA